MEFTAPSPSNWGTRGQDIRARSQAERFASGEVEKMFAKELRQAGHIKRFTISEAGSEGWEVRVEQDSEVVRRVHYTDWHRVERAVLMLSLQVSELQDNGWLETQPS